MDNFKKNKNNQNGTNPNGFYTVLKKMYCNEIESLLLYNHAQNEAHT